MPLVIVGPHGAGKSSLFELIVKKYPVEFAYHVTYTTRAPDVSDDDDILVSRGQFEQMIADGDMIEYEKYPNGHYDGYSRSHIFHLRFLLSVCHDGSIVDCAQFRHCWLSLLTSNIVSTVFTKAFVNQADNPFLFLQIPWSITLCDLNCFCGADAKQSGLPIRRGSPKGELAVYVICNCLSRAP